MMQFYTTTSPVGYPAHNTDIAINNTNWHHIVYTYDGAILNGYLDGTSAIAPVSVSFSIAATLGRLFVGNRDVGTANSIAGSIDEVRIYNRGLSS